MRFAMLRKTRPGHLLYRLALAVIRVHRRSSSSLRQAWVASRWSSLAWWRYLVFSAIPSRDKNCRHYFTVLSNRGAGIGHQLSNWLTGVVLAEDLGCTWFHCPLGDETWDSFLTLSSDQPTLASCRSQGLRVYRLPKLAHPIQVRIALRLMRTFRAPVAFVADDLVVPDLTRAVPFFRQQYERAPRPLPFSVSGRSASCRLVAVHVRRGDLHDLRQKGGEEWKERWLENTFFIAVCQRLKQVLSGMTLQFHIFSQGDASQFESFGELSDVQLHLDGDPKSAFLFMSQADFLVCSPSSFSFSPGLLNPGIKFIRSPWWHTIPPDGTWVECSADGTFEPSDLRHALSSQQANSVAKESARWVKS